MANTVTGRRFIVSHRAPLRVALLALAAAALAAPILVVGLSPGHFQNVSFSVLRLAALYAFTLIFLNILTGALRVQSYMLFNPRRVYRFHIVTGLAGFALAAAHGFVVVATGHYQNRPLVWVIGPVALALLLVTMAAALDRKRWPGIWRRIHQVNYVIFVAIFVKAILIGSDVVTITPTAQAMKAIMILYVVVAALAAAVRVRDYLSARVRARAPGVEAPADIE